MALQKQTVTVNFAKGLQTKVDPFQVPLGNFTALSNTTFDLLGANKKRNGYANLGTAIISPLTHTFKKFAANIASGKFIAKFKDELVMGDGLNFFSRTEAVDSWAYKGRLENTSTALNAIYQDQYNNVAPDCALNLTSGLSVYAWESWTFTPNVNGTLQCVRISIRDTSTNQEIINFALSSTTSRPRCVAIGANLYVVYYDSSVTSLLATAITSAGPGATTTLANNIDTTSPNYDLLVNNSLLYVAYNGTGSTVKVASFNSALVAQASVSKAEVASNGIGAFADSANNVWVAYNNSAATKAFIMNSALAVTVLAPTVVDAGATALNVKNVTGTYDGTQGIIFYDQPGVPVVGQLGAFATSANFTQPAVGATVGATFAGDVSQFNRQLVYITDGTDGGYYYVQGIDITGTMPVLLNLGYVGNSAPGSTINTPATIAPAYGYSNARVNYNTLTSGGVAGTAALYLGSAALASRAITIGTTARVLTVHDSTLQPTYFMSSLYNIPALSSIQIANISAKIIPSEGGGLPRTSILPNLSVDSSGRYNVALPKIVYFIERTQTNLQTRTPYNGIFVSTVNFSPTKISTQELGQSLNIAGGVIQLYDGEEISEQGYHIYPENVTGVWSAGGGSLDAGTYGYQIVYSWIDAQGQIHRSAPSAVLSIATGGASGKITLTIPTLRITQKQNVTIEIYRTEVNGTIYFREDTQYTSFPLNNSVLTNSTTFVSLTPDANIVGNEQIYTTGEIENIAPPASTSLAQYKNRETLVPSENPYQFWYSKQNIPGSPIEFSDLFVQNIGSVGGGMKAIAVLDDKIILGKGTSLYYMTGDGPAPSGANNDFSFPQFITADCGVVDVTSVVVMPLGLMFKAEKGIYLLDRSMQSSYIGADVESYNNIAVVSAQLIPKSNEVRFLLANSYYLMYDYFVKQWSVFSTINGVSDVIHNNLQVYLDSSGVAHRETPGVYADGATPVARSITLPWVNLAGLQGFERAYFFHLLARYLSAHTLRIDIAYDYDPAIAQSVTITPNAGDVPEQWRVFLTQQKFEAFQVTITEVVATAGAGFILSGIDISAAIKSNYPRLAANKQVG